ncbi:hypothetical protein TNCV_4539911 [Trichonephila clavipes]|nr:hypothetical protein TNCV_4539911 [Trichonephila clavipes]
MTTRLLLCLSDDLGSGSRMSKADECSKDARTLYSCYLTPVRFLGHLLVAQSMCNTPFPRRPTYCSCRSVLELFEGSLYHGNDFQLDLSTVDTLDSSAGVHSL